MNIKKLSLLLFSGFLLAAGLFLRPFSADAIVVQIYNSAEEGVAGLELRTKTLDKAFGEAVFQDAVKILPCVVSPTRQEILKEYLETTAGQYVTGYKELSSKASKEGLEIKVDVEVNRRALREMLQKMGTYYTCGKNKSASVLVSGLDAPDEAKRLKGLMLLSGIRHADGALPEFTLVRGAEGRWEGGLRTSENKWTSSSDDIASVWSTLWGRYFSGRNSHGAGPASEILKVSGWFMPDGVYEFDHVLSGWEGVVEESELLDLEMRNAGITAKWSVRVTDLQLLKLKLREYLPGRGLNFTFSEYGFSEDQ